MSGGDGECLRAVDAHKTVGFAPRFGGKVEVFVFVARFEVAQFLADSLICGRAYPEAHERRGASGVMVEVAEDKLSFAPRVGRHDDMFAFLEWQWLGWVFFMIVLPIIQLIILLSFWGIQKNAETNEPKE